MNDSSRPPSSRASHLRIENVPIATDDLYEILFEHFPDIIHSADGDGRIVFTNSQAAKLLGYTRQELIGMNIRELYTPDMLEAMEQGFEALKSRGDFSVESAVQTKDGERIPVEIRSFSIYDEAGQFLRTFSVLRDIRRIKELQDSLVHSERMAAIGELASGITHDIRNPLSVISMSHEMLSHDVEQAREQGHRIPEDWDEYLEHMGRAAQVIGKLAEHLQRFSRTASDTSLRVNLAEVLHDAKFLVSSKLQKAHVTETFAFEEGADFPVTGSPNQLQQVFANLFSNACDAMEGRDPRHLTVRVEPSGQNEQTGWLCSVQDSGSGIPESIRETVFTSFFTTKEEGKGTGLGLSIAHGIIQGHGGTISITDSPEGGATFQVFLPQAEPPPGG